MKVLLALPLIVLMACGAMAMDKAYPGPAMGIFFSVGEISFVDPNDVEEGVTHPQTILEVTPSTTFRINVVSYNILGAGATLDGYELGVLVPTFGFLQGAWNFMGDGPGLDGSHPTVPGSYSRAHAWSSPKPIVTNSQVLMWVDYFPTSDPGAVEYKMGPYDATAQFPKLLIDGNIVFCEIGPDYGSGGVIDEAGWGVVAGTTGIVATEAKTWSGVKSLFQ